jgi:Leucine-rich repeat (LRR) protein
MKKLLVFASLSALVLAGCGENLEPAPEPVDILPQIPDPAFRDFIANQMDLNGWDVNKDGRLSSEEAANVNKIEAVREKLSSVEGLKYFTGLDTLVFDACGLSTLDVTANTKLLFLWCSDNALTTLDLSKNTALTYLNCVYNKLVSLDVSKSTSLTYLNCLQNSLTALDVSNNRALIQLNISFNNLTSLDVSNNVALEELECTWNSLPTLDISNNTKLYLIGCGNQVNGENVFVIKSWFDNDNIPDGPVPGKPDKIYLIATLLILRENGIEKYAVTVDYQKYTDHH